MTFRILGIVVPTDELHHFSEGLKPPTRYLLWFYYDFGCRIFMDIPFMSIYVHLCPLMSIYVHLCPCMSIHYCFKMF